MKACETCRRTTIGVPYQSVSVARAFVGLFFVYAPILFMPIVLVATLSVYVHLRMMGARDIKPLTDFLPDWKSHRYRYKTQVVHRTAHHFGFWNRTRAFWFFNCTLYCPFAVGLLEWSSYLVKLVENWWCPFAHGTKHSYADAPIDYSYWHITDAINELHQDDRSNPVWNQDTQPPDGDRPEEHQTLDRAQEAPPLKKVS